MNDQLRERMRTHYPPGTRVQLLRMDDPYAPVPSGMRGTVTHVDDMGQLQMHWDTVKRAIRDLEKASLIRKEPHYRENGSATSNRYYIL